MAEKLSFSAVFCFYVFVYVENHVTSSSCTLFPVYFTLICTRCPHVYIPLNIC